MQGVTQGQTRHPSSSQSSSLALWGPDLLQLPMGTREAQPPLPQHSTQGVTSNLEAMRMAVEPMSCSLSLMLTTSTR